MDENKTYEPIRIEIEVGSHVDALSIANGLVHYLMERRHSGSLFTSVEAVDACQEDIRVIGEALLSVYEAFKRAEEVREKLYKG